MSDAATKRVLKQAVTDWGANRLYQDGSGNWRLKKDDHGKRIIAPYNKGLRRMGITPSELHGLLKYPAALTQPSIRMTPLGKARAEGKSPYDAQAKILAYLAEYGKTTREDLPAATNLPSARVEHVLALLLRSGLVTESKP